MVQFTILSSSARIASGNQAFSIPEKVKGLIIQLDVTVAATEVDDILAVWLQGSVDGTNYYDIGRFADVLGNGGAKRYIMNLQRMSLAESDIVTPTDAAMAASTVNYGALPSDLRLKWTVTDAGADNASFTFSVSGNTIE